MDPSLTLRTVREDEFLDFGRAMERIFLETTPDEEIKRWRKVCPTDRFLVVTDPQGAIVGTAGSYPLTMSWPGGTTLGCAAVTGVTVRPDHRRHGMLRALMQQLLEDAVASDEPVAALYASEGGIYGRFGFGPAATLHRLRIARDALATIDGDVARVELVVAEEAKRSFPAIMAEHAAMRGGSVLRDDAWWALWLDHHQEREPNSSYGARWHARVPGRGYVVFRGTEGSWRDRRPDGTVKVDELVALDPEAAAALGSFVASIDLVTTVAAPRRPVDDPVRFLVANEAEVDVKPGLPLWLRLVDLPTALAARGYDVEDRVVLEVTDEQLPANAGRWELVAGSEGATCEPTSRSPDVVLPTATLASLVLGGHRATTLADAGRLPGTSGDVVGRLDRLFAVARAPWTSFEF